MKTKKRHAYFLPGRKERLITMKMLRVMHENAMKKIRPKITAMFAGMKPWTKAELRGKGRT